MGGQWQTAWLLKDARVGQQELLQNSMGVDDGSGGHAPAAHAVLVVGAAIVPKGHRKGIKVLDDGPQHPQLVNAEDEVEPAQVEGKAVDGDALVVDGDVDRGAHTRAAYTVTVGHHD